MAAPEPPASSAPPLAQRLKTAAAQPIHAPGHLPEPSPTPTHTQATKVDQMMKSMDWSTSKDWPAPKSGPKLFDALWSLKGIGLGKAGSPRRLVIFSDPGTGFDLALARQIQAAGEGLDADILVLPLGTGMFDEASGTKVAVLSCLSDPAAAWLEWSMTPPDARGSNESAWGVFLDRHVVPTFCSKGPDLIRIFHAATALGIDRTPYVVFPDGQVWPTATPSLVALLGTLEYQESSIDPGPDRVLNE